MNKYIIQATRNKIRSVIELDDRAGEFHEGKFYFPNSVRIVAYVIADSEMEAIKKYKTMKIDGCKEI